MLLVYHKTLFSLSFSLNPDDPKFGVGKAKAEIRNGNGLNK
jgi:hypothetical protein